MRGGLESSLSLPALQAKQKLRGRNRELHRKLANVRTQLSSLQTAVRAHLDSQEDRNHTTDNDSS